MILCSCPLNHSTFSSISGDNVRQECEPLFPRTRNVLLSRVNTNGFKSYRAPASQESLFPRMAIGSNVSEDTDDMFDDLFEKYGKVVYKSNDQKSAIKEVDDDAESLSFAVALAKVASDVKAADIKVLFVKPLVYWTRFFIIATAFSRPQIDAIGSRIRDLAETRYGRKPTGDSKPNSWTLSDFGDIVVHIYFFHNKGLSTTWKSSTAMRHLLSYLSRTNNHFGVDDIAVTTQQPPLLW